MCPMDADLGMPHKEQEGTGEETPSQQSISFTTAMTKPDRVQKIRRCAFVFSLIIACAVTILISLYFIQFNDPKDVPAEKSASYMTKSPLQAFDVCNSTACADYATTLNRSLDGSINPCDNFYRFVCNGWMSQNHSHLSVLDELYMGALEKTSQLAQNEPVPPGRQNALQKAAGMYQLCIKNIVNEHGNQNFMFLLMKFLNDHGLFWPFESSRTLLDILLDLSLRRKMNVWFQVKIIPSEDRSNKFTVYFKSNPEFETWLRQTAKLSEKGQYVSIIQYALNATEKNLDENEVRRLVKQTTEGENLLRYYLFRKTATAKISFETSFCAIEKTFNNKTWSSYLNAHLGNKHHKITGRDTIKFESRNLKLALEYLFKLPPEIQGKLSIGIGWFLVTKFSSLVSSEINRNMRESKLSIKVTKETCLHLVDSVMPGVLQANYYFRSFNNRSRREIQRIFSTARQAMMKTVNDSLWIAETSKQRIQSKIIKNRTIVEFESIALLNKIFDNKFDQVPDSEYVFFQSWIDAKERLIEYNSHLHDELLQNKNFNHENRFAIFHSPVFQLLSFNKALPSSVIYGTLGQAVSHYLSHSLGIDSILVSESKKSSDNLVSLWDPVEVNELRSKVSCYVRQYFKKYIQISEEGLDEVIADVISFNTAYAAFKSVLHRDQRLTGLEQYSSKQLFFMSSCYRLCSLEENGMDGEFKCNAPLMNNFDFSHEFKCPLSLKMNPYDKCHM